MEFSTFCSKQVWFLEQEALLSPGWPAAQGVPVNSKEEGMESETARHRFSSCQLETLFHFCFRDPPTGSSSSSWPDVSRELWAAITCPPFLHVIYFLSLRSLNHFYRQPHQDFTLDV